MEQTAGENTAVSFQDKLQCAQKCLICIAKLQNCICKNVATFQKCVNIHELIGAVHMVIDLRLDAAEGYTIFYIMNICATANGDRTPIFSGTVEKEAHIKSTLASAKDIIAKDHDMREQMMEVVIAQRHRNKRIGEESEQ